MTQARMQDFRFEPEWVELVKGVGGFFRTAADLLDEDPTNPFLALDLHKRLAFVMRALDVMVRSEVYDQIAASIPELKEEYSAFSARLDMVFVTSQEISKL